MERPKPFGDYVWAGVAVVINECVGGVLVGKRASNPGDPWSGDASLPGGHYRPVDGDLVDTAVRETREEVGLDLETMGRFLGVMEPEHPGAVTTIKVLPSVFVLNSCNVELRLNSDEFVKAIWVPLSEAPRSVARLRVKGMDRYAVVIDDVVIWGLTYRILSRLTKALLNVELPP
jgi:8-oxo-dGTP pyrophosphatase MutT (NUDIX family)